MVRPLYARHLLGVYAAQSVKKAVRDTPVFAVHRILTPDEAEGILERDEADAVTLVRAPHRRPRLAGEGARRARRRHPRLHRLQPGLLRQPHPGPPDHLRHQPGGRPGGRARHRHAAPPPRAQAGGRGRAAAPPGLEAAWVAAARGPRGHPARAERPSSGGKIRLAQRLPGRGELADFADWRAGECERRGVDIRLGRRGRRADAVLALEPDAVVVATGGRAGVDVASKWHPLPVPGSDQPFVIDHEQALRARGASSVGGW